MRRSSDDLVFFTLLDNKKNEGHVKILNHYYCIAINCDTNVKLQICAPIYYPKLDECITKESARVKNQHQVMTIVCLLYNI